MKNIQRFLMILCISLTFYNCSSVKVLDAWKSDEIEDIKSNNFLFVARTNNSQARIAL